MTHAYQEIYLSNAQALLGDAFDYAINACGVAGDSFIKLFSVSSVSNRIENGEPSYLLGKSGIETAVDVLVETTGKALIPTSSVSARFMAARRQSLPSEAMSVFAQFKCTNSATRTSTKPVRRLFLALQKSSAVRWRIFWKRKSVTKRVVFPLKYHMNYGNVIAVKGKP